MSSQTKILFPTEFGPLGEKAKDNAVHLARKYNAELVLFHSVSIPHGISKLFSNIDPEEVRKRASAELDAYAKEINPEGDVNISTLVKEGRPEHAIVEAATEQEVMLIIFGTKGGSGLRDTLLGSAVNYVIRHAPCPVLTIRNTPEYTGFNRILVPLDLAKEAQEKVMWGVKMAQKFNSELYMYSVVGETGSEQARLEARMRKSIAYAKEHGVEKPHAETEVTSASVADAILHHADKVDADLICIMTQQESESSVATAVIGTVADRLVNISQYPILSIRPERHYARNSFESPLFT